MGIARNKEELIRSMDVLHGKACEAQRDLFALIVQADLTGAWEDSGARDLAHWLSMRYGISYWKASRWIQAAHGLVGLPGLCEAFASGELGVDKVVELARFATPETEGDLIAWAKGVSVGAVRHKADLAKRQALEEVREAERQRFLRWWWTDDGRKLGLEGELPAADGAVVAKALDRLAEKVPVMPGEEDHAYADARRADALVALSSAKISEDADPDRATVVVHARVGSSSSEDAELLHRGIDIEDGPVIHPETAKRLMCSGRIQTLLEDEAGDVLRVGRLSREPSHWMLRQLKHRDRECQYPRCGSGRFLHAHHIVWVEHGGKTELENLVLLCSFHHKLVHEHGWRLTRRADGSVQWFWPSGIRYEPGPARSEVITEAESASNLGWIQIDARPPVPLGKLNVERVRQYGSGHLPNVDSAVAVGVLEDSVRPPP